MPKKPYSVGITGGTCSGKSTITTRLEGRLGSRYSMKVFHMDSYFLRPGFNVIAPITRKEYIERNHPDAVDMEGFLRDFNAALSDSSLDLVITEGLFTLWQDEVREKLDLKVFIDLQSDERLYRRIKRWLDRQSMEEIADRYLDTVRFRHDEFVEPSRWHADIVINGNLDSNAGTDILVSYIKSNL